MSWKGHRGGGHHGLSDRQISYSKARPQSESHGSLVVQGKLNPWDEFLRQKTEEAHGCVSHSIKSVEAEKSDRTSTETHIKHLESEQTAGKMTKTLSSGSLEGPAKVNSWKEFLRQKTEEEAKFTQRSQRTKDYAAERNKTSKENSKPAEDSGDNVNESRGSSSNDDALTLDDIMIGRRNYMGDDDMSETMSQMTSLSSSGNLSVTIAYNGIEYSCGECSCMNKDLKVTETHVRMTHRKKANVVRYNCTLCKFKTENLESWKDHEEYSYHKNRVQKERQKARSNSSQRSTEKRKLVDEAGFTVPHQRASEHSIKRTGVNDPWSKETTPLWSQRSAGAVGNKMTPWEKKQNSESSADSKRVESNSMDAGTILFSSSASKLVKTPPWEKKPVLNFDSAAATSIPNLNLAHPHVSTFDAVSRQSATSGFRTSERPSSSSSTILQRASVSSAAPIASPELSRGRSTENKDTSLPNKSLSEVKHSSEQHKITISQYQNRHGARIPSSSVPSRIQQAATRIPMEVQDPRKRTHSSKLLQDAIITKPISGVITSSGSSSFSSTKTAPGNPWPVYSSSATKGTTVSSVSKSSSSALESSAGITSKTKPGISISNAHKSKESNPFLESNTSPDQRSPRNQGQSQVLGNKVRHSSDASISPADHNKRYTIPKMKTATTITSSALTVTHISANRAISTMPKKSDAAALAETTSPTTAGISTGTSKAMITMQKKPETTVVKSASIKSTPNRSSVVTATSTVSSTGASNMVSGDLLSTILPTLPYSSSNRASGSTGETKSDSKDIRSTSHASVKSSESSGTKHRSLLDRHERSRHSSGAGSAGSLSPLHTEKSPSDRETAKGTSLSKTTLGIKEKNAVYDPRQNCVALPSMRYSKSSEKQHAKERPKPNSSTQEESGTNESLKAANKPGIKSSSSVAKHPAKIQQPTARTPVEIQDPRKVTHDSKLSQGALKIKPIPGFRIPKQKTVSVSEDSADELSDEKTKNSGARKSPNKKKKKHKKDKDEEGVSTTSKSSNEKKDRSNKHGELTGHASGKMSCESVFSGNTVVAHSQKTRHNSTGKPSSVTKISIAENTKTGERPSTGEIIHEPSSDDNREKNNNKCRSLHTANNDDPGQSERENETKAAEKNLQNDFSVHSTNEQVELVTPEEGSRKSTVEKRKESISRSKARLATREDSDRSRKVCTPSTSDKETHTTVAVAMEKGEKKNNRNVSTDARESNTRVPSVNTAPKVFGSPPWSKQSILGLDLSEAVNTSETSSTDVVHGSTTLQRPVKDANQQKTLPKTPVTGEASSLTLSEQTGQESMSGTSNQASSNLESESRASENEVVEKRGPKHKNSFVEIDEVGRMLCWICNGKVFPKCSSIAVSSHLRETHMKLTSALYECTPCNYTSEKCREFQGHMKTAGHTQNVRQAICRRKPNDNSYEMLTAGEDPLRSSKVTIKVEDTSEMTSVTSALSSTNTTEKQTMNETNPSNQRESTDRVVKLLLKVENDSSDEEPEQKPEIRVKKETPAFISPSLPSEQKPESFQKCKCSDETYVHIHCPQCGITAKSSSAMRDHRLTQHGIIPEGRTYRCPLDDCGGVYIYPSGLKKHITAHIKKEKNSEILHYLETQLKELETFVRPHKSKVKEEIPPKRSRLQIKIPRTNDRPKDQKKLIAWYVRRKKRLLKDFGMTNAGRNSLRGRIRDRRILRNYRCVVNNQEAFKCKRCDKILKTTDGFKYHMVSSHNIRITVRPGKRRYVEIEKSPKTGKNIGVEDRRKSVEMEEKKTIQKFLQVYEKGDRYHCDKCFYSTSLPKQGDFREHLYKKHNVFEPSLRHYECNDCTPVFRTIKQNKIEAHLLSPNHIKTEKAKMAQTEITDDEESDETSLATNGTKRTELLRVVKQYQHGSNYACSQCSKTVESIDVFVEHMYVEHDVKLSSKDCNYYQCEDCVPEFRTCSKTKLHKHELGVRHKKAVERKASKRANSDDQETGTEPVRKKPKVSATAQKKSSKSYTVSFSDTEIFRCDTCKLTFKVINDVGNHLDTSHKEKISVFLYKCKICEITEKSLANFREHMKTDDHELNVALAKSRAEYEASKQTSPEPDAALARSRAEYEASKQAASDTPRNVTSVDQGAYSESEQSDGEGVQTVFSINDKGLNCVSCKFLTKIFAEIMSHKNDRHHRKKETIMFECEVCNFKCSKMNDAQIHIISDGHDKKMNNLFWEYVKITTDIAYKITKKDQIVCRICRRKIYRIDRLLTHAEEKHELPTVNIRIICILCSEILVPGEIENHRKTDSHLRFVEKEIESSETDSCPPTKKSRPEEVDAERSPRQLEGQVEEFPEASSREIEVPEQHDEPAPAEGATAEAAPPRPPALRLQPSAPTFQAPAPAPKAPARVPQASAPVPQARLPAPFGQPYRQVTLADFTTAELFEELCTREDYYACPCGFAYHKDRVASYLHKSCHAVNDWHKCSNCYKTFPDAYSFITHLFCKEGDSSTMRNISSTNR